ncbi:MAG: prepilin-type N-terminal cleavage/methylation domain-containing protein [Candidatus Omnitrophica bacterium]|nr:prepilin-type N-terminal cleavage/methylation domain-containing protein [Candidatus Omnitrophota bacterium]
MQKRGFTLLEVLVAVSIVAIIASVAIPQYTKAVQRSYWRTARDILQTIYSGEQVYETDTKTYVDPAGCAWRCIYMDDPNSGTIPVTYSVGGVSKTTFTATATYTTTGKTQTVDENRNWGGTWVMP